MHRFSHCPSLWLCLSVANQNAQERAGDAEVWARDERASVEYPRFHLADSPLLVLACFQLADGEMILLSMWVEVDEAEDEMAEGRRQTSSSTQEQQQRTMDTLSWRCALHARVCVFSHAA